MDTPRHILILIHSLGGGGAERVTVNLANIWAAKGDRVTIVTNVPPGPRAYSVSPTVTVKSLNMAQPSRGPVRGLFANIRRLVALRRLLRQKRPDIVIGMMITSAILTGLLANGRFAAIGAERIYPLYSTSEGFWKKLRMWSYPRLDAVTCLTRDGADWLSERVKIRRLAVIPNAIHFPLTVKEPFLPVPSSTGTDRRLVLGTGRLNRQKGFDRLIDAFARVADDHPEWDLVILGEGALRPDLTAQIAASGLADRIRLPGWAGNLADWYGAADLFVLSSRHEGFPGVLVEAMAHGCPVLAVDCKSGPRDIISHDHNGLLIPQDDSSALRDNLDRLMGDAALRGRLAANAPEVRETFSPERIGAQWQELFSTLGKPATQGAAR